MGVLGMVLKSCTGAGLPAMPRYEPSAAQHLCRFRGRCVMLCAQHERLRRACHLGKRAVSTLVSTQPGERQEHLHTARAVVSHTAGAP